MHVTELSREELDELKYNYADERTHGCSYEELMGSLDIPDDVIFEHYDGIDFVKDDFFAISSKRR